MASMSFLSSKLQEDVKAILWKSQEEKRRSGRKKIRA
jgi:hypothetical protein